FNLEPSTSFFPQNEESLDFLLAAAAGNDLVVEGANDFRGLFGAFPGVTGYYVSRDADGTPEFEGGLPALPDPLVSGKTLVGQGDPTVAADPPRSAIFMSDSRLDDSTTAVGVFRTTSTNLQNTTNCPNGTHTPAQAATCWPTHTVVNPLPNPFTSYLQDSPHLTVDERASGVGAGDVYVTATEFDFSAQF